MNTPAELIEALRNAKPGDVILLEDGIYSGEDDLPAVTGMPAARIVVRAKNPGKVIVRSGIHIKADYLTIDGLRFEHEAGIEIEGEGIRITNCVMSDVQTGKWIRVLPGSRQVEIDHCRFENKTNNRVLDRSCQLLQIVVRNESERHHIHHNHFVDIPDGKTSNGYETLQLITEGNPWDPDLGDCNTVIEHNLFERCNGESEIISVKANANVIRHNTFRDSRGGLVLRHGDSNRAEANVFLGYNEPRAGGVRLQGEDQVVTGNYFGGLGSYGVAMMDGTPDSLYVRTQRTIVSDNVFVDCRLGFDIGLNHSKHPNGTPPIDCRISRNIFTSTVDNARTVRFVQDDEPVNWTWEDNLTDAGLGIPKRDGLRSVGIERAESPAGLTLPAGPESDRSTFTPLTAKDVGPAL